ncbi:MAG: LCP family protein [Candidatus Peribacteria bacterium]|nr:LCP family protein [Candidatus Peribacteria bacterium]
MLNDAPDLTDTIILLKANTENKTISMLSIPRDLYVKYP